MNPEFLTSFHPVEEEFRIQKSEFRSQNQDAPASLTLLYETQRERYQSGIQTGAGLVDHQIGNLVGVQKRRLFRRSCVANAALSASRTKFILNSGS